MQKKPWEEDWSQPQGPVTVGSPKPGYQYEGPKAQADLANAQLESEAKRIAIEKARRELANTPDPDAPVTPTSKLSGLDYLKTLPPADAALTKSLAEGRMAFPTGAGLRSPYWQKALQNVANYDPTFDAVNYGARAATRKDFTSGKSAQNIKALNTAIGHVGQLYDQIGGTMSSGGYPLATTVNSLVNSYNRGAGSAGPTNYAQTAGAVASELTQVFRGTGGAEADVKRYLGELDPNASLEQKQAAVKNIMGLLKSRLDAIGDQYTKGMGTTAQPLNLLDDHAQKVWSAVNGGAAPGSGGVPPVAGGGIPPISGGGGTPPGGGPTGPQSNPLNYAQGQYGDATNTEVAGATKSIPNELGIQFMSGLNSLFHAGASDEKIRAYASQFGVDPSAQLAFRKANPGFRGSIPPTPGGLSIQVPVTDPMSRVANAMAGSPTGTFVGEAGNAAGAGIPQWAAAQLSGNPDLARARFQVAKDMNPRAAIGGALAGSVAGNIAGEGLAANGLSKVPILFRGLQGADRAAAIAPWAMRAGDAGFGAITGATNAPEGESGKNALIGGTLGLGGGMLGRRSIKTIGSAMRGVSDPNVGYLAQNGVPLTFGQTVGNSGIAGRMVKGMEDRLSGFPIIGDQIGQRVSESMKGFNKAAFKQFNDVASPLSGQTVNDVGPLGVEAANRSIGGAYDNVLSGVRLKADEPFTADMGAAIKAGDALPEPMRSNIQYTLPTRVGNSIGPDGTLTGNDLQQALRGLRGDASSVRSLPYGNDFGAVTGQAQDALIGMVERQAPGTMPALNQANEAYRMKSVLQNAVNAARNGTRSKTTDIFTPSQLSDAAAANARRFGNTQGTTNQPFFDLTRAGQDVLPNKVPDSGTAGRMSIPIALSGSAGAGAAIGQPIGGLAAGMFGTALYSKAGQKALRGLLLSRPEILQQLGLGVQSAAPYSGALGSSTLLQLSQP